MKKYLLIAGCSLIIMTGCVAKSSVSIDFGGFSMKRYDNKKTYQEATRNQDTLGIKVLNVQQETPVSGDSGYINSFVLIQTNIQTGVDIASFAEENAKKLQLRLLGYSAIESDSHNISCRHSDREYSGYFMSFSYHVDTGDLYGAQYFLADQDILYLLSLSSDQEKDIKAFAKSIDTIACPPSTQ